jgi:hypothetical protein
MMESNVVGQLTPRKYDLGTYVSEPFEVPYFDNRSLVIVFTDAEHQTYLQMADHVLQNFLKLNSAHRLKDSPMVYDYYAQILKFGYTNSLEVNLITDIWKFVEPIEIVIQWDETGDFYLCVSCECEWEREHGLQLVFKNGETLTRASGHDGHFSD